MRCPPRSNVPKHHSTVTDNQRATICGNIVVRPASVLCYNLNWFSVGDCHETRSDIIFSNWIVCLGRFGGGRRVDRRPNSGCRRLLRKVLTRAVNLPWRWWSIRLFTRI